MSETMKPEFTKPGHFCGRAIEHGVGVCQTETCTTCPLALPAFAAPAPSGSVEGEPVAWGWVDPYRPEVGFRVLHPNRETALELVDKFNRDTSVAITLTPLYAAPPREGGSGEALTVHDYAKDYDTLVECIRHAATEVRERRDVNLWLDTLEAHAITILEDAAALSRGSVEVTEAMVEAAMAYDASTWKQEHTEWSERAQRDGREFYRGLLTAALSRGREG